MKKTVLSAPPKLILPAIIFTGVIGNIAADAAFIVFPPIAALIFMSFGRNPIVAMVATYAAISGGYSANLLINSLDVLLAGITEKAAQTVDPSYVGNPAMNYYFLIVSTFFLVILATWVTKKFVEPRFPKYQGTVQLDTITPAELTAFCENKLSLYKVPTQFFIVREIKQTYNGKIDRRGVLIKGRVRENTEFAGSLGRNYGRRKYFFRLLDNRQIGFIGREYITKKI